MRVPPRWTLDDLVHLLDAPDASTVIGPFRDRPLVVVDLPDPDDTPRADARARLPASLPLLVVARGSGSPTSEPTTIPGSRNEPAWADVVVHDEAGLERVVAAVDANPHAATVLAQLLRLQAGLAPSDALAAESLAYATLQGGHEFAAWLGRRGTRVRRPDLSPRVRVEHRADAVVLTLDRPRLFNLYDAAMRDELVDALRGLLATPDGPPIELRGAGRAFCAGGDPAEFGTTRDTATAHLIRSSANAAPLLLAAAPRLHAHVHGPAVGAGCELAAFAASVSAAAGATFSLPEVAMGLVPGAGGTVSVARRIGRHRTAWMALTGDTVDATTARAWGLVDAIVDETTTAPGA